MAANRPNIPEPMKRRIRQRCGFGCVVCGLPLYTYEHMDGWATVRRHDEEEITLLCDGHQRERTNGLLPVGHVRSANRRPCNKRKGHSHPYALHYTGSSCKFLVGGNDFERTNLREGTEFIAIAIDRFPMLSFAFSQGHLFLTLQIFDDQSERVLSIERNEMIYCPTPWDIRFEGRRLCIREGQGRYLVDIEFWPPDRVELRRGRFSLNGLEVLIYPDLLLYANNRNVLSSVLTRNADVAVMIGEPIESGGRAIHMPAVNRGRPDREAVEKWMREAGRVW